jgi:lactoylglutathione lyase
MVTFSHTIFYVKDLEKIIAFYEKAFGIKPKFVHESGLYAELNTGGTTLAFADETLGKENLPEGYFPIDRTKMHSVCEIVFTVKDVQKAYDDALLAGAVSIVLPKHKPWGQTVAYVKDPSGVLIEIASLMAPE